MNGACYDCFMSPFERVALNRARHELIAPLRGRILEIGSGTGANFSLYRQPELVSAVEPDPAMMDRAIRIRPDGLVLHACAAEQVPLPDSSIDHIVSTLVFCSVSDLEAVFTEMKRVLKTSAHVHIIEHVKGRGFPGRLHELCTPFWSRICGGCHLNRRTVRTLVAQGFTLLESKVILNFLGTPFVFARFRL